MNTWKLILPNAITVELALVLAPLIACTLMKQGLLLMKKHVQNVGFALEYVRWVRFLRSGSNEIL